MTRLFPAIAALLLWVFAATAGHAADPLVEVEFEETATIPGQPLTLRLTVLVPTWLPKPVVFPSFEAPNILVQLPEGASGPTSRQVEGESWSGVTRRYRITPMVPGVVTIPAQAVLVTWAEPGKTEPLEKSIPIDPVTVEGILPEGAEGLDPFLAATGLSLERDMPEVPQPLRPGDSITLTVTASIDGTSAMFLPPLLPPITIAGFAAYPAEPVITDRIERGLASGTRVESVTLVAQGGGAGEVPAVELSWYNIKSGAVETATLETLPLSVDGPALGEAGTDRRATVLGLALGIAALGMCWAVYRRVSPRIAVARAQHRAKIEASEPWAFGQVMAAAKAKDLDRVLRMLDLWAGRCPVDPRKSAEVQSALSTVGAARYGRGEQPGDGAWQAVTRALATARAEALAQAPEHCLLPGLNPTTPTRPPAV